MEGDKIAELIKKEDAKRIETANYDIDKVLSDEEKKIFEDYKYDEETIRQIRGGRPQKLGLSQDMYDFMKEHKLKTTLKDIADGNNELLKWCIHEAYIAGLIAGKNKSD
jgi:predicted transcriptional regulator